MRNYFLNCLLFFIILINFITSLNDYDRLLSWGKEHSLIISEKLGMNYISENNKTFYLKDNVIKNEILLRIPKKLLLTLSSALELSGKKINKFYEQYKNYKWGYHDEALNYRIQQSFIAYLMYNANKHKSSKNKFYTFYKYLFTTYETSLNNFPIFYTTEQLNTIKSTVVVNDIFQMQQIYEEEFFILEKEIIKKKINYDEYMKYRTYTFYKGKNITGINTQVPFLDMFEIHPTNYNLNYNFENNSVIIYAIKKINKKDKLFIKGLNISNSMSLIFYGKTFDELNNIVDSFNIPYISSIFLEERGLDQKYVNDERINLANQKFYEKVMPIYMKFSKNIKEDGSPLSALRLFKGNLVALRNNYDKVSISDIHKFFFTLKDIQSIKRIFSTEKKFFDEKIKIIDLLIDYTIHNNTDKDGKKRKDNEDLNIEL